MYRIFLETKSIHLHFAADSMGLSFRWNFSGFLRKIYFCKGDVQGHPRSLILVPIESTYATSY